MDNLKEYFISKKFWMMVIGLIISALVAAVPDLEQYQEVLPEIIWVIVAYIIGQGLADFGKHGKGY